MKRWSFFILSLALSVHAFSQSGSVASADIVGASVPRSSTHSTDDIAGYINDHSSNKEAKIRAAYWWVTHNIRYDTDSMYAINAGPDSRAKVVSALRRKRGVCENFAAILVELLTKCGITAFVVDGSAKPNVRVNQSGHSWCVVKTGSNWLFCDPTWDINFSQEPEFFLIEPEAFIYTHFPFDPIWQFTKTLHSAAWFHGIASRIYLEDDPNPYLDSIASYLVLSNREQLKQSVRRVSSNGIVTELFRIRVAWLNMKLGLDYEDNDVKLYNAAIADFNSATSIFNQYIINRNNRFFGLKSDAAIAELLVPVDDIILSAIQKLNLIQATPEIFQLDASVLNSKLVSLTGRVNEQKEFLKKYFAYSGTHREKLFYSSTKN